MEEHENKTKFVSHTWGLLFMSHLTVDDPETTCPSTVGTLPGHLHLLLAREAVLPDSRSPPLSAAQALCSPALPVDGQPSAPAPKSPERVPEPPCHLEGF
jgi:hypothetical protein